MEVILAQKVRKNVLGQPFLLGSKSYTFPKPAYYLIKCVTFVRKRDLWVKYVGKSCKVLFCERMGTNGCFSALSFFLQPKQELCLDSRHRVDLMLVGFHLGLCPVTYNVCSFHRIFINTEAVAGLGALQSHLLPSSGHGLHHKLKWF